MIKIEVYLDDGRVYSYEVTDGLKAREHAHAISQWGYRHNDGTGVFEQYPAHRILKIKATGEDITTKYPDVGSGT